MRRIYEGPGLDWCNGLSSDIRYLSHPDWRTGNIAIADLRTGSLRPVTTTGSISLVAAQTGEFGECTVFSPDDRQIAYYWRAGDGASELRTIGVDGSRLRVLYRAALDTGPGYLQPVDWSADGQRILTLLSLKNGSGQIASISVTSGAVQVLKNLDGSGATARFSPDGRYLAYSMRTSAESTRGDVFVIASDGTRDTVVVRHPADDALLGWAADGGSIFFASDRTGSYGVWQLDVETGAPRGAPVLVKPDLGAMTPIRLLNGTLYYAVSSQMSDVYIASMDPESGKALSAPMPARADFSGSIAKPDWSPDGTSLAYLSLWAGTGAARTVRIRACLGHPMDARCS